MEPNGPVTGAHTRSAHASAPASSSDERQDERSRPARGRSFISGLLRTPEGEEPALVAHADALSIRAVFRRFWPATRPYRRWLALGLVIALILPVIEAAEIWMFKLVVDDVLTPRDLGPLLPIAVATVGIVVLRGLLTFVDDYLGSWVGERFVLDVRTDVFRRLQRSAPDGLETRHMGDTLARVTRDVDNVEGLVVQGVVQTLSAIARILLFVGLLFYLDWLLAMVAIVVAPVLWALAHRFAQWSRRASREAKRRAGGLASVGEESLANLSLVKAYGVEDAEAERFHREGRGMMRAELAAARIRSVFGPLVDLIELSVTLVLIGLGTWAVADERLTLGGLLVFLAYLTQLYSPVRELGGIVNSLFTAAASAERVIDVMDQPIPVTETEDPHDLGRARGELTVEDVTFTYPGVTGPTLRAASLDVRPGECVALVGGNGAGKSTLAKLLVRFHDPDRGRITIDGHDIRSLSLASLRRNVTVLLQETLAFNGTVRRNLELGRPGATDDEIANALMRSGADAVVASLPDGLATQVGQRGRRLSGGQRQRLAIARALLHDAPVVVLDEPTTGLDADARTAMATPLAELRRGRTVLMITHDPEMIALADRVVRLEDGTFRPGRRPSDLRTAV